MSAAQADSPAGVRRLVGGRGFWAASGRRLAGQPVTMSALLLLVALFVAGAFAQRLAPGGWNDIHLADAWKNNEPGLHHGWLRLFGTDHIGRSVLARTIWGLHYSETAALFGALLAGATGVVLGSLAGLYGGVLDAVLMRFADFATTFPVIVTMIAAFTYLEPMTVRKATLVFALYLWAFVARVVRARIKTLSVEEFVEAARALGASELRILVRHLLPNAASAVIVATTALVGQIMLVEATAEFFGFGVNSLVRPTLGNLIADSTAGGIGRFNVLGLGWWVWATPAVVLVLVLVCVNLVGDGLATALDPRAARR